VGSARNDVYFTADQAARVFAIARAGRDAVDLESALLEALRELEHVLPALGIEAVVFHRGRESPLIILSGTSEFLAYRRPVAARSSYERRDTSSFPPPGVVSTLAGDARVAHKVACAETLEGGALLLCIYRGADLPAPDARERALLRLGAPERHGRPRVGRSCWPHPARTTGDGARGRREDGPGDRGRARDRG
jgi:hypothetical protein